LKAEGRRGAPKTGLTAKVREAARERGRFRVADLAAEIDIRTYEEARKVRQHVLRDMLKSGEVRRIDRGLYEYAGKTPRRTRLDVIWHLVRSNRQFTTDEIERLSGAARYTVLEYLHCLRRLGYLRQAKRAHWQLIKDPGPETPVNTAKCQKLKRIRENQKAAAGRRAEMEDR